MNKLETRIIGQHKRNINVVQYQSGWKEKFKQEKELLQKALGKYALQIEHIGSTSIVGIDAKPVIDIMVAIKSLQEAKEIIPMLVDIGYIYRPDDTIPERMFFAKEYKPEYRTHHLNLAERESKFWKNQIIFRNYLRKNHQVADEYVILKKRLAEEYEKTKTLDREGKTKFVTKVLDMAKKESGQLICR